MMVVYQLRQTAIAIANLNNNAATEMEMCNNFTDAYRYLSTALSTTKRALQQQRDIVVKLQAKDCQSDDEKKDLMEDSCDDDLHHDHHQRKSELQDPNLLLLRHPQRGGNMRVPDDESTAECYLFHRPFELNVEAIEQSIISLSSARATTEILTVSVVYNLALVHHLHAAAVLGAAAPASLRDDDSSTATELLHRALALYNQATRLLRTHSVQCDCDIDGGGGDILILLKIAISNNMGHAYYRLGGNNEQHRENALRCFQDLARSLSMYCHGTTTTTTAVAGENRNERNLPINNGFLSNVCLLYLTCNTAAAA